MEITIMGWYKVVVDSDGNVGYFPLTAEEFEAEEVRIDEPFRLYPQRLVALMEWRDGAYWWLDENNHLTRIPHGEWLESL